jgi:hypothetical protein
MSLGQSLEPVRYCCLIVTVEHVEKHIGSVTYFVGRFYQTVGGCKGVGVEENR